MNRLSVLFNNGFRGIRHIEMESERLALHYMDTDFLSVLLKLVSFIKIFVCTQTKESI